MTSIRRHRLALLGQGLGILTGLALVGTCAPALGHVLAQPAQVAQAQEEPSRADTQELGASMWASGPVPLHVHVRGGDR